MIIVLDSNEYINYLSKNALLLDKLVSNSRNVIYINETITKEVINNLNEYLVKKFYDFLFRNNINPFDKKIPFSLLEKYKRLGLKKGDIVIAAFCDDINADYIVTENRHFLKDVKFDKFKVITLADFVKIM